jgi:hypothetical protein
MCFLKPQIIAKVSKKAVLLKSGIKVIKDKKIGPLRPNDRVLVFGNLIVEKID